MWASSMLFLFSYMNIFLLDSFCQRMLSVTLEEGERPGAYYPGLCLFCLRLCFW